MSDDTHPPHRPDSYDPRSPDAMFARILQRMDTQDLALGRIERGVEKTNGRVSALEKWRDVVTAKVAGIAATVSALVALLAWLAKNF